ncbi:MAG: TOBE domain-containing protein [Acidimicrobiales bacterium]
MQLGTLAVPLPDATAHAFANGEPGVYTLGVRPEHLAIGSQGLAGEVTVVEELGSEAFVFVTVQHRGAPLQLVVRAEGETPIRRGDQVQVDFKGPVHVFAPSGARVGD